MDLLRQNNLQSLAQALETTPTPSVSPATPIIIHSQQWYIALIITIFVVLIICTLLLQHRNKMNPHRMGASTHPDPTPTPDTQTLQATRPPTTPHRS